MIVELDAAFEVVFFIELGVEFALFVVLGVVLGATMIVVVALAIELAVELVVKLVLALVATSVDGAVVLVVVLIVELGTGLVVAVVVELANGLVVVFVDEQAVVVMGGLLCMGFGWYFGGEDLTGTCTDGLVSGVRYWTVDSSSSTSLIRLRALGVKYRLSSQLRRFTRILIRYLAFSEVNR